MTDCDEGARTIMGRSRIGRPHGHSAEERAARRARVVAAKDALSRSAALQGAHVASARAALKAFLRGLDEPTQPSDAAFQALLDRPFSDPHRRWA
jgi:hypothetical protein